MRNQRERDIDIIKNLIKKEQNEYNHFFGKMEGALANTTSIGGIPTKEFFKEANELMKKSNEIEDKMVEQLEKKK